MLKAIFNYSQEAPDLCAQTGLLLDFADQGALDGLIPA